MNLLTRITDWWVGNRYRATRAQQNDSLRLASQPPRPFSQKAAKGFQAQHRGTVVSLHARTK